MSGSFDPLPACILPDPLPRMRYGDPDRLGPGLARTIVLGFVIIALCFGGFSLWATLAPLRGAAGLLAAVAPGA